MSEKPIFSGRTSVMHGFALKPGETPAGETSNSWWGSQTAELPEGTREIPVRLQAEDGAHSSGILYMRGGEKTAVIFNQQWADFSSHFLAPMLVAGGFAVLGCQTRYVGNDVDCQHECLLADVAAQIRYLRAAGFEKVVLGGNSGGGPISTFYMAQAMTPPPGRLKDTAAGDPYDLNALDLPPADGVMLIAAALSQGVLGIENLDPSVTDEADAQSCDPALDMFNPDNGYRKPPESSSYSPEFLALYRAAQRERCARIDARARAEVARKREYRAMMQDPGFALLPLHEQNRIQRQATSASLITVYRTAANPGVTDLSISPSKRRVAGLMHPDPQTANWSLPGFVSVMTAEGWLSTWSGLSTRVDMLEDVKRFDQPLLIASFERDVCLLPHEATGPFANAASPDKQLVLIDGDHFGFLPDGEREAGIFEAARVAVDWLKQRFPCAANAAGTAMTAKGR